MKKSSRKTRNTRRAAIKTGLLTAGGLSTISSVAADRVASEDHAAYLPKSLAGKVAFVTGAARGIGRVSAYPCVAMHDISTRASWGSWAT